MGTLRTKKFWADTFERAVSTSAQAVIIVLGLSDNWLSVINQSFNLKLAVYAAAFGFVVTVLKALAASQVGDKDSASLIE